MKLAESLSSVTERTRALATVSSETTSPMGFRRFVVRVPFIRRIVKEGYEFYELPSAERIKHWDHIWQKSPWYEVSHQALYYYQHKTITRAEFNKIKNWILRCDSWEHSDDLSKIYAQVVEDNPDWILPLYEKWNTARSPWKRRQSVVGLIEYASKRHSILPFDDLIHFVEPLLNDEDYYVQKGVGWTLREIFNVYPAEALDFLDRKILSLSSIAFSTSTEKLDKEAKAILKQKRKIRRDSST